MSSLERLWAGWRGAYVSGASGADDGCLFCRIFAASDDEANYVVHRGAAVGVLLNAFPYTSGHVMVAPLRHVGDLEELTDEEGAELWRVATLGVAALKKAYAPEGINIGANLGRAAGAGVPGHLHLHALPRWNGDTNFMTAVADTRVLPEALHDTWAKLRAAWPV